MRLLLKVPFIFLILVNVAIARDGVGNGAGLAEKNIALAWTNLEKYIDVCLAAQHCRLDVEQKAILKRIRASLPDEKRALKSIEFKSERENPGFFLIRNQVRIAKTGNHVGDVIWFNVDLLYTKLPSGNVEALSVSAAVALLIHELGHHQGEMDHTKLDLIGAKVQNLLQAYSQTVNAWPYFGSLWASITRFENRDFYSQILVWDDAQLIDLSQKVIERLRCPSLYPSSTVVGADFLGIRWDFPHSQTVSTGHQVIFKFSTITYCSKTLGNAGRGIELNYGGADVEVAVTMKPETRPSGISFILDPNNIVIAVKNQGYGEDCRTTRCTMPIQ